MNCRPTFESFVRELCDNWSVRGYAVNTWKNIPRYITSDYELGLLWLGCQEKFAASDDALVFLNGGTTRTRNLKRLLEMGG